MKNILYVLIIVVLGFCSCSEEGYLNAIPEGSKALISIDMGKATGVDNKAVLKALLHLKKIDESGLDFSNRVFLFSSPEGNLGLCAKVSSESKLKDAFAKLVQKGLATDVKEFRSYNFTVIAGAWVVGFSSDAMLLMGPVEPASQAELRSQMAKQLSADEEDGITASPLYAKIDSLDSPFSMVATVEALPEKMSAPLMLGAPKDADPSQVVIAAELKVKNHNLYINSEQFSFNKRIDASIKKSLEIYRPIKGKYVPCMSSDDMIGMFVNADGLKLLPVFQQDKEFQALLTGINTAIDMDNIIRSVDGDLTIKIPKMGEKNTSISMTAQLKNDNWLTDVNYWKESCPQGSSITDWIHNGYHFKSDDTSFYFAVSSDMQFLSGSSPEEAINSLKPSVKPLSSELQQFVKDKKMVMLVNFGAFDSKSGKAVTALLNPLFGNVKTIVYSLK